MLTLIHLLGERLGLSKVLVSCKKVSLFLRICFSLFLGWFLREKWSPELRLLLWLHMNFSARITERVRLLIICLISTKKSCAIRLTKSFSLLISKILNRSLTIALLLSYSILLFLSISSFIKKWLDTGLALKWTIILILDLTRE